jgi:hypothetical protein
MIVCREQYPYRIIVVFKNYSVSGNQETLQCKTNILVQCCLYAEEAFLLPTLGYAAAMVVVKFQVTI